MQEIKINTTYTSKQVVAEKDLACNVGSGIVRVYATPMMIALMEHAAATCLSNFLEEGETSVGVHIDSTHDAATPCGMKVEATAEIIAVDRKKVTFHIIAKDETGPIGEATHSRFIVTKETFEQRAQAKLQK